MVFKIERGRRLFCLVLDGYHVWTLPKGHLEPGETAFDAARRETAEEVGLRRLRTVRHLGPSRYTYRRSRKVIRKTVHWYLMKAPADARLAPSREENILAARWMPLSRALRECGYAGVRAILARAGALAGAQKQTAELPPS